MTPESTKKAFDACAEIIQREVRLLFITDMQLRAERYPDTNQVSVNPVERFSHLLWMCEEGKKLCDEGREPKAMRWLGFVQGALHVIAGVPIHTLKKINHQEAQ